MNLKFFFDLISLLIKHKTPKFSLVSIKKKDDKLFVIFKEICSGKIYKQDIKLILTKSNVLSKFSSSDACKIGYTHGKYLSYQERNENAQNKFVVNDNVVYNYKTFC